MKKLNQPSPESLLSFLRGASLFREFDEPLLKAVSGQINWYQLQDGQLLFQEGKL
jgi:hypothetical protein